jgi:4-hydroxybenzoate polyprenyltransferase
MARVAGLLRLVHAFPSFLDGIVTATLVAIAGGDTPVAVRLGMGMLLLQCSIGALNDLADIDLDRETKPGKPIPRGQVTRFQAALVAAGCLFGGLALAATSGPATLLVALLGVSCGYAYDLWLKGTALSWLAWSAGISLLPLFAWLGAGRGVSGGLILLMALAAVSGLALALANGLADYEADTRGGVSSPVVRLGPTVAWRLAAALEVLVVGVGLVSIAVLAAEEAGGALILVGIGIVLVLGGVGLSARARPESRERGWELQAAGVGVLAAGWVAAMVAASVL